MNSRIKRMFSYCFPFPHFYPFLQHYHVRERFRWQGQPSGHACKTSAHFRWVADVPPRETSPAAKSEEKRMFSQAMFQAVIDYFSSMLFMIFLILVFCKNKAMSASCPQQKFHSSTRFRSLFLSSLGSLSILFLRAKLGECVALWFALTPPQLKWLTEQKNPFVVCKHAARYNEFGYKTSVARIAKVVWGRRLYCIFRKSAAVLWVPT